MARRYIAVIQAPEGYPLPGTASEDAPSVPEPVIHQVVLATVYEAMEAERDEWRRKYERAIAVLDCD
jgi:hypothetical protein